MSRTARLLEVLITLQTKPRFTVQELAEEFGVSRRTMLRDLHALSEMGVPLAASPGPYGGYSLIRDRRLLPLSLSPDEAIGIVLSYEAFLQYAESPFSAQSLSAITKLRNALPPDVVRELDRIRQHVVVLEVVHSYSAPLLAAILQAALEGVHLDIVYDSRSGTSERRIFPYGLFASHGFWYCPCYDYKRHTNLSLRADRFQALARVEGLEQPDRLSPRQWLHMDRSDGGRALRVHARATRRGAKSFELETLFGPIALNEQGEAVVDATIPESELEYYAERFLTLGVDLVVESPRELVEVMRRKAQEMLELYTPSMAGRAT